MKWDVVSFNFLTRDNRILLINICDGNFVLEVSLFVGIVKR